MKLPSLLQFRILKEAIRAIFKGPYTTRFPYRPHVPAEKFRGKPEFDEKECVGCSACCEVCPSGALTYQDETQPLPKRTITLRIDTCIFCGQCQANCITEKGIRLTSEYDLATTNRNELYYVIEKDLALCEVCGGVIASREHILWVAEKLGPLAFSNPSLMLASLQKRELIEPVEISPQPGIPIQRSDRIRIICPKCRREVVFKS